MDLNLSDKVVAVTGGGSGIGGAISATFAEEGATVAILARKEGQAAPLIEKLSDRGLTAYFVGVELTDTEQCERAIESVVAQSGRLDCLVNNAGVNDTVRLRDDVELFRQSLEKNIVQVFACTHFARPHLAQHNGSIVNIGSKVADTGQGGTSGYAASKGAMNALTREWALSLANDKIRVNCVVPAEVITPMYRNWLDQSVKNTEAAIKAIGQLIPFGRRTTTEDEIAAMTVFLGSNMSSHTTGQIIYVDGGYTHLDRAATTQS